MGLNGKKIILGVGGGIAAYKAADLCSQLIRQGAHVRVAMTDGALKFVAPLTFEALSQHPVYSTMFNDSRSYEMEHISWARWADQIVICPATADLIASLAHGFAGDAVTSMCLAYTGPVLIAPAMNTQMLLHPATQQNLETLRDRSVEVLLGPEGRLACGEYGPGRLAEPAEIIRALGGGTETQPLINTPQPPQIDSSLTGLTVMITSGPTHEYIDPTRFMSNPSSGKMGAALALAAARRGAAVQFITGPVAPASLPLHPAVNIRPVTTADEMLQVAREAAPAAQLLIFAAAVSDFRSAKIQGQKIKRTGNSITLPLVENADISHVISSAKTEGQVTIGFAAETEDLVENATQKLTRKRLDAIVANDVSNPEIGFQSEENAVTIVLADGTITPIPQASKAEIADEIMKVAVNLLGRPA